MAGCLLHSGQVGRQLSEAHSSWAVVPTESLSFQLFYIGLRVPFQLNVPGQPTSSQTSAILWSQQPPAHAPNIIFSWKTDAYRRLAHERWHPRASSLLKSLYFHERLMLIIMGVHRHTNPRTSGLSVILHAPFKLSLTSGDSYRLKLNTNTVFEFYLCYRMYDLLDVWWHALVCLAKAWLWKLPESATPPDTRNSQIPDALPWGVDRDRDWSTFVLELQKTRPRPKTTKDCSLWTSLGLNWS